MNTELLTNELGLSQNLAEKPKSLVVEWAEQARTAVDRRNAIGTLLAQNNVDELIAMGFPAISIPIMRQFFTTAPGVFTSFSHPEEVDMYKIVAVLNTRNMVEACRQAGIDVGTVSIINYDVVDIHNSALKPFRFSSFGKDSDYDVLGLRYRAESSQSLMSPEFMREKLGYMRKNLKQIVLDLYNNIAAPYMDACRLTERLTRPGIGAKTLRSYALEIILARFERVLDIYEGTIGEEPVKVSQMLVQLQQQLTADILDIPDQTLEQMSGFDVVLYSDGCPLRTLVMDCAMQFMETTEGFLRFKSLFDVGQGIVIEVGPGGVRRIIGLNEKGNFCYTEMGRPTYRTLADKEFLTNFATYIPLARLETLTLVLGGYSIHIGTERGAREAALEKLGFTGEAAEYIKCLRIGEDNNQGNEVIKQCDGDSYPSLILMATFLSSADLRQMISTKVGVTEPAVAMSDKSIRTFIAARLVKDVLAGLEEDET